MVRTRNEKRWKIPFEHHASPEEFLAGPRTDGAHAVNIGEQFVDLLIQDRGHRTTLVVFSGRLSLEAKFTPQFSGLGIAKDVGVNLISVADPSMSQGAITVAWYMGNRDTGPLRPLLSPLIRHVLDSLDTERTILFGGSGGGFAAANYAHDFPGCIAFIFNPRLTLLRHAKSPVSTYLRECHNMRSDGIIGESERETIEPFGPLEAYEYASAGLNHNLLIYQNLLDSDFLGTQVLPYLERVKDDPKLHLNFSMDDLGHTPIPSDTVRSILKNLAVADTPSSGVQAAGFMSPSAAVWDALRNMPSVAARLRRISDEFDSRNMEFKALQKESENAKKQADRASRGETEKLQILENSLHDQRARVAYLQKRLQVYESASRYIPTSVKKVLRTVLRYSTKRHKA